ncbi:MAG TPA: hypothetical protein VGR06_19870 [Actinophytocola sp.]|uniref:hypothetical protein n=1 Tax=Actinophytocola sp. TaxID=1872138 RepID=UPI002E01A8F5|nr:hypothetical protein [Actinophytocola sp.]
MTTLVASVLAAVSPLSAPAEPVAPLPFRLTTAAAFDVSPPLRELAARPAPPASGDFDEDEDDSVRPVVDNGYTGDGALQQLGVSARAADPLEQISPPRISFEGVANSANPILISPPDPNGEVGPNHYVQTVNVQYAVYSKTGARLAGPAQIGTLFAGFPITDCTGFNGDPVVLYDQQVDRWLITQFTVDGPEFWNCVAISTSPDPTGTYFRYAFSTGPNFPDYPKYGVWNNSYFLSTREFAPDDSFAGIGAYALEKARMVAGNPNARAISFLLPPGDTPNLTGDGLLPTDWDGSRPPRAGTPNWFVGTQDDGAGTGAAFDALNVFEFNVDWRPVPRATFGLAAQIPVAAFDSIFPCAPGPRNCIPQPGTTNKIDILSSRQRPIFRLAYRNFGTYESLVTNQSVEARPAEAGTRWYELRRPRGAAVPTLFQQGTLAPGDGIHRWMGSIAQDKNGNMALGYSASNGTDVFPGIRYTGRLAGDPAGLMARGEQTLIAGTGVQTVSPRWGDYTDLTVDPSDDCTFWYTNEYYTTSSPNGWTTRIGSFKFPSCRF